MIITDSAVTMSGSRQYRQSGSISKVLSGKSQNSSVSQEVGSSVKDAYEKSGDSFWDMYSDFLGNIGKTNSEMTSTENSNSPTPIQNTILAKLLERIMNASFLSPNLSNYSEANNVIQLSTYEEYESTSFHADGQAHTADGRTIDFNIDLMMSRSYIEYTNIQINPVRNALMDPLVINVGGGITNVSDQKFLFDLDCDGEEESISRLGRGSGFLALDKNEDGIINDGRELFGATTGDGFGELKQYDSDNNGWIDEADEIFSKLKVWCQNENGEDVLMDLKQADIGAIYLGEQNTEFSMYGTGGLNGVVRSTGFFLKESGGLGTVQHVDLAYENSKFNNKQSDSNGIKPSENEAPILSVDIGVKAPENKNARKDKNATRAEFEKERKKRLRQRKDELSKRLMKKRQEKKEMIDKQLEKQSEKRHEQALKYKKQIIKKV